MPQLCTSSQDVSRVPQEENHLAPDVSRVPLRVVSPGYVKHNELKLRAVLKLIGLKE
jgi:hypothetical protein